MDVKIGTDRFRAVTAHKDLYASIDKDIDILEGQIRKMKTKKYLRLCILKILHKKKKIISQKN